MFSSETLDGAKDSQPAAKQLTGILVCKCWCHESGSADKVCVKCLTRMAAGEEQLSDAPPKKKR